jgi:DNA-binding MarR family transcriptional regulator
MMSYWVAPPEFARTESAGEAVQTITLTQEEAAAARQLLLKLNGERKRVLIGSKRNEEDEVVAVARAVYQSRKMRSAHFGSALFSEPAWDMLLVLFLYGERGDRMSVTKLAEFSQSALTTAIRWLDYLESQRWIVRTQCEHDRRKFFVCLSEKGRSLMVSYFERVMESGNATIRS